MLPAKGTVLRAKVTHDAVAYDNLHGVADGFVRINEGDVAFVESLGLPHPSDGQGRNSFRIARVRIMRTGRLIGVVDSKYLYRWDEVEETP
jgi:hypothetical protein